MKNPKRFMVRVYGLLISPDNKVLISKEAVRGVKVIKFPGGGLELGEGPAEAIVREFQEETGLQVRIKEQFYTSDFFVQNRFNLEEQVIGIYFVLECDDHEQLKTIEDHIKHLWIPVEELTADVVTFEMDKAAVGAFSARSTRNT